eukprot:669515-Heterocapsa_arctica.AAC.1
MEVKGFQERLIHTTKRRIWPHKNMMIFSKAKHITNRWNKTAQKLVMTIKRTLENNKTSSPVNREE